MTPLLGVRKERAGAKRSKTICWRLLTGGVAALTLFGCSSNVDRNDVSFERPVWMSDQVQRQQEYQATLQSCVDSKGWNVTITRDGGVEEPFANDEYERYAQDRDACRLEAGLSDGQDVKYDEDQLATIYDRDLDTVACLRAEGYDLARPQSKEAYIETSLKAQNGGKVAGWWPYGDQALEKISEAEYQRLQQICPEPWWSE